MEPNSICRKPRRLAGKQREICRKEPEIVAEVAKGTRQAISECQVVWQTSWNDMEITITTITAQLFLFAIINIMDFTSLIPCHKDAPL